MLLGIKGYLIGAAVMIFISSGAFLYIKYQQAEMATLKSNLVIVQTQAKHLEELNSKITADIANIQQVQGNLMSQFGSVRQIASEASRKIRARDTAASAKVDPKKLQSDLNTDWQNTMNDLGQSSHAQ